MKLHIVLLLALLIFACKPSPESSDKTDKRAQFIDSLLNEMTLEEKAGQLNFYVGDRIITGPNEKIPDKSRFDQAIKDGKVTGFFNINGTEYLRNLQKKAVEESRLHIPLVFGADVIHGFKTIFPIPLSTASSWDLDLIERSERVAAIEATASGINFNFAPMVDLARDPRWGRIAEGAGEDPYLGGLITMARVRGFQGDSLNDPSSMAACVKHYAAYGAPEGGRDYNTVDMSERRLRETYLEPYRKGVEAGAKTIMSSFNEVDGVPVTGSEFLLRQILREEWGFDGMVVSDWQSMGEMIAHGYVKDSAEAAKVAITAGLDMDMMSDIFLKKIPGLVESGELDIKFVDQAVRNVLGLKYDLGLFEDPYKYCNPEREAKEIRTAEHLELARKMAQASIVLLKNNEKHLPLSKNAGTIAVIGPLADKKEEMNGMWTVFGSPAHPVSYLEGIKEAADPGTTILTAEGCGVFEEDNKNISKAVKIAKKADVVVLTVGESEFMSGEGASRSDIKLPGIQQELVNAIVQTGKPVIVVVTSGRPLDLSELDGQVSTIVQAFTLGSESGHALADVLFGDYNPSGKLPVSFPRNVGQIPVYYSHKNTGRPYTGDYSEPKGRRLFRSNYIDVKNTPLFPFGHGLSYSTFVYSDISLSSGSLQPGGKLIASVEITNEGPYDGEEVVQMYIRDLVGSVTRPVKELKGFKKLLIKNGETVKVEFEITEEDLAFYRKDMSYGTEPGDFKVFIGTSSDEVKEAGFVLQ